MRFTVAAVVSMAAAATATVIPRAGYGAWNVTFSHSGGNDKQRTETVSGLYANSAFADNISVNCHYQGMLNGEIIDKTICDPESFSYVLENAGYDDGYLYQLTLTQTVTLSGTNVTVKGVSDKFKTVGDKITDKSYTASDIIINASSAIA